MKAYVLAVEKACNAKCDWCITNIRQSYGKLINIKVLKAQLKKLKNLERIEITGGGEPTLHPDLQDIVMECSKIAPVQLTTHGANYISPLTHLLLETLCLSRQHYDDKKNERLMGIKYNFIEFLWTVKSKLKISVTLDKQGIGTINDVINYDSRTSSSKVEKIIFRQMFEPEGNEKYQKIYDERYVSSKEIVKQLEGWIKEENYKDIYYRDMAYKIIDHTKQDNPILKIEGGNKLEFEIRSCACELNNPVIHADGKITQGWNYDIDWKRD